MKKVILLGIFCLLIGCRSLQKVSNKLNAEWVGKSYDEFVIEKGIAKNSYKLSDGQTMYLWEEEGVTGVIGKFGNRTTVHCTLNVLVDKNNIIKSVKVSGNPKVCHVK